MYVLCVAPPLQGGNVWTAAETAALTASMAAADKHSQRDWKAVAAYPGLENRTGVGIQACM
jgi:hypothetical protein